MCPYSREILVSRALTVRVQMSMFFSMELHNHPSMTYGRARNWPPVWTLLYEPQTRVVAGEIGVLEKVSYDAAHPARCELTIKNDGVKLIGTLLFDNKVFCRDISNVLRNHISRSIKEIGSLDISDPL